MQVCHLTSRYLIEFCYSVSEECTHLTTLAVNSSGFVFWTPSCSHEIRCNVDVTYFPFDKHQCSFQFGSWLFDNRSLALSYASVSHVSISHQVSILSYMK